MKHTGVYWSSCESAVFSDSLCFHSTLYPRSELQCYYSMIWVPSFPASATLNATAWCVCVGGGLLCAHVGMDVWDRKQMNKSCTGSGWNEEKQSHGGIFIFLLYLNKLIKYCVHKSLPRGLDFIHIHCLFLFVIHQAAFFLGMHFAKFFQLWLKAIFTQMLCSTVSEVRTATTWGFFSVLFFKKNAVQPVGLMSGTAQREIVYLSRRDSEKGAKGGRNDAACQN